MKAAEDLKQQQLKREQERQNVLKSRIVALPDVDSIEDKCKEKSDEFPMKGSSFRYLYNYR